MKSIVLYDTRFGNTAKIARIIAESISARLVTLSDAHSVDFKDIDLLVVGSPTHGGRATPTLQEFLDELPNDSLKNINCAVFDTRFLESDLNFALKLLVRTIGYAAPKIADLLVKKGGKLLVAPKGFIVKGKEGPLAPGEVELAKNWLTAKLS